MTDAAPLTTLILGGARSGKSSRALALAESSGQKRCYIATAQALDAEMSARIATHQAERGEGWRTLEASLDLADAVTEATRDSDVVLIDCLTLWLSNLMHNGRNVSSETTGLIAAMNAAPTPVIVVSNEVGMSIVPENRLAREFRDAQGRLNQHIAAAADVVELVAAGLSLKLKG